VDVELLTATGAFVTCRTRGGGKVESAVVPPLTRFNLKTAEVSVVGAEVK
jgi:hypothetical protein